eukprot:gb/GECH01012849.1/.p1 GENE.gb/GECH01012849.1/~~gb/GECH01012849.1/.p1  ORF type:complete len:105 (+),score=19.46 gb/GECH01012849.1/:1-315(+)
MSNSSDTPDPSLSPVHAAAIENFLQNYKIECQYLQARECADAITFNARLSLQDNLNRSVQERLRQVPDLYRVVSVNYSDTEGVFRKHCAIATVWYETLKRKEKE